MAAPKFSQNKAFIYNNFKHAYHAKTCPVKKTALSLASCIQMVFDSINTDSHM